MNIKKRKVRLELIRTIVQIGFFIAVPWIYSSAFAEIKNIFAAIGNGEHLKFTSFTITLIAIAVVTILLGRVFCGWVCAFGTLGDIVFKFSRFIQKKAGFRIPGISITAANKLKKIKYLVLTGIIGLSFFGKNNIINQNSPWTVFSLLRNGRFDISGNIIGIIVLLTIIIGMACHERFFCMFLCPMGAIFELLPVLPIAMLKRDSDKCPANCGACRKTCPAGILIGEDETKQSQCICCMRCKVTCPKNNIHF